jgi:hypothetical protein
MASATSRATFFFYCLWFFLATVVAVSRDAAAALRAAESFDGYAVGQHVNGANLGSGWGGPWVFNSPSNNGGTCDVISGKIPVSGGTYTWLGVGSLPSSQRVQLGFSGLPLARFAGPNGTAAPGDDGGIDHYLFSRPLSSTARAHFAAGKTTFLLVVVRGHAQYVRLNVALASGAFVANRGADLGSGDFGLGGGTGPSSIFFAPCSWNATIFKTADTAGSIPTGDTASSNAQRVVVVKLSWGATATTVSVYPFPEATQLTEANFNSNSGSSTFFGFDPSQLDTLTIGGGRVMVDEIRIGDCWQDITTGGACPGQTTAIPTTGTPTTGKPTTTNQPITTATTTASASTTGVLSTTNTPTTAIGGTTTGSTTGSTTISSTADESTAASDAGFPWWIILVAVGVCCVIFVVIAVVVARNRRAASWESDALDNVPQGNFRGESSSSSSSEVVYAGLDAVDDDDQVQYAELKDFEDGD